MKPLPHIHGKTWLGKAVLFDLDGVLVDATAMHRQAFRQACHDIAGLSLDAQDDETLEGLPTRVKLERLLEQQRLASAEVAAVAAEKQRLTSVLIEDCIHPDPEKVELVQGLARAGYAVGCYSNAIGSSVTRMLGLSNLMWPMSIVLSNEAVPRPKPAPDGWTIAMYELEVHPDQTLIVEDSAPGIASARASGAHVMEVTGPDDVTRHRVDAALKELGWESPLRSEPITAATPPA